MLSEQTGFIPSRHSFSNIQRLFHIIYTPTRSEIPECVISLDAEIAFDRVEWEYLFMAMRKFDFGKDFISWVEQLYASPLASVNTNNLQSKYFTLYRGTRQGCPLSPLLFALAIEPLAASLRQCQAIEGITRGNTTHKLSLYADDLLLYIADPVSSLPHVLSTLEQF